MTDLKERLGKRKRKTVELLILRRIKHLVWITSELYIRLIQISPIREHGNCQTVYNLSESSCERKYSSEFWYLERYSSEFCFLEKWSSESCYLDKYSSGFCYLERYSSEFCCPERQSLLLANTSTLDRITEQSGLLEPSQWNRQYLISAANRSISSRYSGRNSKIQDLTSWGRRTWRPIRPFDIEQWYPPPPHAKLHRNNQDETWGGGGTWAVTQDNFQAGTIFTSGHWPSKEEVRFKLME